MNTETVFHRDWTTDISISSVEEFLPTGPTVSPIAHPLTLKMCDILSGAKWHFIVAFIYTSLIISNCFCFVFFNLYLAFWISSSEEDSAHLFSFFNRIILFVGIVAFDKSMVDFGYQYFV